MAPSILKLLFFIMILGMSNSDDSIIGTTQVTTKQYKLSVKDIQETTDKITPELSDDDNYSNSLVDYRTWLAASVSILLISLCGIFGVLVVPIMQKMLYQHLVQFLIAMAVGSLIGDALIHLLPHALLANDHNHAEDEDHDHDQHSRAVWLGCVASVSIIVFFFLEKSINLVEVVKTCKQQNQKDKRSVKVVREGQDVVEKSEGKNKCMNKYSQYCVAELPGSQSVVREGRGSTNIVDPDPVVEKGQDTVIITHHEVEHHGHSHGHSHLHSTPRNITSVAWMVVMGDGIHNLADGLAIGAAFASGFHHGVSTSVAVLCHELPHEIGDFAMLLKAGMSIKQAIFFNVISSIIAFIGVVVGILFGTITNVTPWIFSMTAGIFLYVALVDMLPELSSGHAHPITRDRHGQLVYMVEVVLQLLGMCLGVSIMLVIAMCEQSLLELFGQDSGTD